MQFGLRQNLFQDARGNHCFQDLALGAIKLLTLPISNAPAERAFSQVTLLKDDPRNGMGLPFTLLNYDIRNGIRLPFFASLMEVYSGVTRNGWTLATSHPPRQLMGRFDSMIHVLDSSATLCIVLHSTTFYIVQSSTQYKVLHSTKLYIVQSSAVFFSSLFKLGYN